MPVNASHSLLASKKWLTLPFPPSTAAMRGRGNCAIGNVGRDGKRRNALEEAMRSAYFARLRNRGCSPNLTAKLPKYLWNDFKAPADQRQANVAIASLLTEK